MRVIRLFILMATGWVFVLPTHGQGCPCLYPSAPSPVPNLEELEYFVDDNRSYGSGSRLALSASSDISGFTTTLTDISAVSDGVHTIYFRVRDINGNWSHTQVAYFENIDPPYPNPLEAAPNVTRIEYFFDIDPGFGNGQPIPFTHSSDVVLVNERLSLAGLMDGNHTFNIRSKSLLGWSFTNVTTFDAILPVELVRFTATLADEAVEIQWETATELNNNFFEVQRSDTSSVVFKTIHRVEGQGTTSKPHAYLFMDHKPVLGRSFYRLKQTDFDGKFTYSPIQMVDFYGNKELDLFLYPNPGADYIKVQLSYEPNSSLTLYDAYGHLLQTISIANQSSLAMDIRSIPPGTYFLVLSSLGTLRTARFVKR